jgi:hypothetical protein
MMTFWVSHLLALGIVQIALYRFTARKLFRLALPYWTLVYLVLWAADTAREALDNTELAWWMGVAASLGGFALGEFFSVLLSRAGKSMERRQQSHPAFFTVTAVYLALACSGEPNALGPEARSVFLFSLSLGAVMVPIVLAGIWERLLLSRTPLCVRGAPILLLVCAVLLLIWRAW